MCWQVVKMLEQRGQVGVCGDMQQAATMSMCGDESAISDFATFVSTIKNNFDLGTWCAFLIGTAAATPAPCARYRCEPCHFRGLKKQ